MSGSIIPSVEWIDAPERLESLHRQAAGRIGLDTEFIRERTFWPVLALVQIASGDRILLVEPQAPGMADALRRWLQDPALLKVMHSPSEDFIALRQFCGAVPEPLFDTQTAAALCGLGAGLGYQSLVRTVAGAELPKGETRTNWLQRPLTPAQAEYAADDVRHLFALHDVLRERLSGLQRLEWLQEDCQTALDQAREYRPEQWPHLGLRAGQVLDAQGQRRLLRLLRWRDQRAVARDLPKNWVIAPDLALQLASLADQSHAAVSALLAATPKAPLTLAAQISEALSQPVAEEDAMPLLVDDRDRDRRVLQAMQAKVAKRSAELGLPDGVLASRKLLQAWQDKGAWPAHLTSWRRRELDALFAKPVEILADA